MTLGLPSTDAGPCYDGEVVDLAAADHEVTAECSRKLYVAVAGNVKFDTLGGTTITLTVANTSVHDIAITKIYKTGTTATGLHVFW